MRLPSRAFSNPFPDQRNLSRLEFFVTIRRRHDFVSVARDEAEVEFALIGIPPNDHRRSVFCSSEETGLGIKPHFSLPGAGVGAVASEAVFGKDWPNIPVEFNLGLATGSLKQPCRGYEDEEDCSDAHETLDRFSAENSSLRGVI